MRRAYLEQFDPSWHWLILDFRLMLTLAIIAGCLLCLWLWRRREAESATAADLLFWGIPGLLIGCKFFYFLQFGFPSSLPGWWRTSGLALYGGLFGLLAVWGVYWLLRPYPVLRFLDCVAPSLALGLVLGRIGCYLAGCNGGIPTDLSWGVSFPKGTAVHFHQVEAELIPEWYRWSEAVHPTQLYESLFGLLALPLLLVLWRQRLPEGTIFFAGMLWYAVYRFSTEPIRSDTGGLHPIAGLTFSQTVSVVLGLTAVGWLMASWRRERRPLTVDR